MPSSGESLGPYVIESLIAQGGMGAVYRARNRVTGQLRALKVVLPELAKNPDFVDRFVREATIASEVRHKNLVETFEPGIDGATIYLPMELLDGETLGARLRRVRQFSPREIAAILVPVAEAVQLLHDRGVIHRDLKPMNVYLAKTAGGETPKVIDLGTARTVDDDEHTRTGMMIGSPYYMAIEQAEGRRDIDARVDQYALATIAYQMVTGTRPYESDDMRSALAKLMRGDPYALPSTIVPGLSPAIERVITRGLERDRELRFPSVLDFGRALGAAVEEAPDVVLPSTVIVPYGVLADAPTSVSGPTRIPGEPGRGRPAGWMVALAVVAVLLGIGGVAWAVHAVSGSGSDASEADLGEPPVEPAHGPTYVAMPMPPPIVVMQAPAPPAPPPTAVTPDPVAVTPAQHGTTQPRGAGRPGAGRARTHGASHGTGDPPPHPPPQCGASTGIPCI